MFQLTGHRADFIPFRPFVKLRSLGLMIIKTLFLSRLRAKSTKNVINSAFFPKFADFFRKMPNFSSISREAVKYITLSARHRTYPARLQHGRAATLQPTRCRKEEFNKQKKLRCCQPLPFCLSASFFWAFGLSLKDDPLLFSPNFF